MNYLNITYNQLLQDFKARLASDPRFKNIGSSTIYGMFTEMIAAVTDMTNFYMQRTAEEGFISTARLDSSVIKHCKNLGYMPRRAVPAKCELIIRLKGPLPANLTAGTVVYFGQENTKLSFNGNPYILDSGYSYTFTEADIANGTSSDWYKDLTFAVPKEAAEYIPLAGISQYNTNNTTPIKCFQGEQKLVEFLGSAYVKNIGEPCQYYDVDDIDFSNWYGVRDPYGYAYGEYVPEKSWCQVGVGTDEIEAFKPENLFAIETNSIYLNKDILELNGQLPDEPLKICLLETNPDKTMRITFSSERNIVNIGLNSYKENVYIKYIATKGKACNLTGVTGSIMTHNNQINVSSNGGIIKLTNNVQFIINSDIYGGEYFEDQNSMKINAPAYFASGGKLITKLDYISYFRGLTSPMLVQNALVFGQRDIEDTIDVKHPLCQNNIFYCLMGHLYLKNNQGDWDIRNVLTKLDSGTADTFSLYGERYLDHICDYVKMLYSYESYYNKQYNTDAAEQWLKNIQLINKNCLYMTEINSVLLSLPPMVQYFDLVGTVYVKPLTDIEKYTREMKNKIYEYLDKQAVLNRCIYKSEIIKIYNSNPATEAVDIDIKVSNIIKSDTKTLKWSSKYNPDFELIQDESLESYSSAMSVLTPGTSINSTYGYGWWNKLKISKTDQNGNSVNENIFKDKLVTIRASFINKVNNTNTYYKNDNEWVYNFKCDVSSDDSYIYLLPFNVQPQYYQKGNSRSIYRIMSTRSDFDPSSTHTYNCTPDGVLTLDIEIPVENDFYSMGNLSQYKIEEYGLSTSKIKSVQADLKYWLDHLMEINSAQRAINLPYEVKSYETLTREESIMRKGYIISQDEYTLSENTFWNYFVKNLLKKYYPGIVNDTQYGPITDIDGTLWKNATNLIMDIYSLVKPGICDSILDNNNNITNFSTEMERACLQNVVNVTYYTNNK